MRLAIVALAVLLAAPQVAAQEANPFMIKPGDHIRLLTPLSDTPLEADVLEVDAKSFDYAIAEDPDVVLSGGFEVLTTLDVRSRSRRHSARSGALWGLFIGTAGGLIGGPFIAASQSLETGPTTGFAGGAGGIVGAVAGAAMGAVLAPEGWYRYVLR